MTSTNFVNNQTVIDATWANDVNRKTYVEYRSVLDFGAKGDGVTDDWQAIQNAINSGVRRIHVPFQTGSYVISKELLIQNKNGFHLDCEEGVSFIFNGAYVAGGSGIKILNSSNIKIENINVTGRRVGWTGFNGVSPDITASPLDFGIYSTSGGPGAAGNNRFINCQVSYCRIAGFCIGNNDPLVVDQTTDEHQLFQCSPSFCAIGIKVLQANTNMTRITGGWVTDFTQYGIYIGNNSRGVTIDSVLMYTFSTFAPASSSYIYIAKENSGPVSILNMVTEQYRGTWLAVEPTSGGATNMNLLTIINANVTNNDSTVGQKLIDHQGAGSTILKNCRFGGAGSLRSGGVGAQLSFNVPNAAVGGEQWLTTECCELYDGATWDVQTSLATGWSRWLDIATTLRASGVSAGAGNPSLPLIRETGRINHEIERLSPVVPFTGLTVNSVGLLGRTVFKATVDYRAFKAAALSQDIHTISLPPKTVIVGCYTDTTIPFAGLAGTITLSVGAGALGTAGLILAHDVKTAAVTKGLLDADLGVGLARATAVQGGYLESWTGAGNAYLYLTSGTGNLGNGTTTNLTAGQVTLYLITETLPQY